MTIRTHLALLGGAALYALALPPFDIAPLAWVALVPLIVLTDRLPPARAALLGAVAGFYTSWAVTWWLPQALSAYFEASLLRGAAVISVAYVLAVSSTFGAFAWSVARSRHLRSDARALMIAAAWTACELIRARGFDDPWALLGYTQYRFLPLIQVASLTGVYGVSFLVALGNTAIASLMSGRERVTATAVLVRVSCLVLVVTALGHHRTSDGPSVEPTLRVGIVQPEVSPAHTWNRGYSERQLSSMLRLSSQIPAGSVDLVVWPENSVTLYPEHEPYVARALAAAARRLGADLVIGAPRDTGTAVANSARLVRRDGRWFHYDKQRLVPFAETGIGAAADDGNAASPRHFEAGTEPGVLPGKTPLGLSICHEILYPDTVHPAVSQGAAVLVNVANDGWLDGGYGVASRQHFAMGVFRAVESRRYLVRAAVGGVSGIVAPSGAVLLETGPDATGVAMGVVAPRQGSTLYVRYGDWFATTCSVLVLGFLIGGLVPALRRPYLPAGQTA